MSAHALFVSAAYGVSAAGIAGLIAWIFWDGLRRRSELAALEESGAGRRAGRKAGAAPS